MDRENRMAWISTVLLAVLVVGSPMLAGAYNAVLEIGDPLPPFRNLPTTEETYLSSDEIGEDVLLLVFLANHCPWVRGGEGDLINLVGEMKEKSVRVVGISVNHREADCLPAMKEHASKAGYNFTYVFDESQDIGRKLGASRTPEFFVFNSDRKLVYMGLLHNSPASARKDGSVKYSKGEPTEFYVRDAVEATLAGKAAPVAETRAHGCNVEYVR